MPAKVTPPKPTSPLTILGYLSEVRKRIPKAWIASGTNYSASVEANCWREGEEAVEYRIHVMRPIAGYQEKHYQISSKSMAATLVELEEKISGDTPQISI